MADEGSIATLKANNAALLNNGVPDQSIDPDEHNDRLDAILDTIGQLKGILRESNTTGGNNIEITAGDTIDFSDSTFIGALDTLVLTAARTWDLPDKSGTIALLSDITTLLNGSGTTYNTDKYDLGGTLTSNASIDGAATYQVSLGESTLGNNLTFHKVYSTQGDEQYLASYPSGDGTVITKDPGQFTTRTTSGAGYGEITANPLATILTCESGGATDSNLTVNSNTISLTTNDSVLGDSGFTTASTGTAVMYTNTSTGGRISLGANNTITDYRSGGSQVGIEYSADYSANFTTRSLVDRGYVDSAVASAVSYDVCAIYDATGTPTMYSSLTAAITAASAGQTVEILADITETGAVEIILKDGININGNGHTYTLSNATAGTNVLKDNNVSVKCKILNWTVVRTTGTGYCLFLDNVSSEVDATGSFFKSTSYAAVCCEGKLSNCEAYTTSGVFYAFYGTNTSSALGSFYNCKTFGSVYGFYRPKEAVDCVSRVSGIALETNSSTNRIINFYGYSTGDVAYYGGGCYVEGGFFVSDANHAFESVVTGGRLNGGYYFSSANVTVEHYGASKDIDINGATIRSTASQALVFSVNATGKVSNCHIESTAASTIYFDSGSTNLELYNCTVICLYNNAAGHTIQTNNTGVTGVIKGNVLEVANTGANCITGLATTTLNYADNIYKGSPTTPINANIAQGITGTEDNQGNILI